jgi:hypothetical protein
MRDRDFDNDPARSRDGRSGLCRLNELKDFKVARDSVDVRGWGVFAENGIRIGKVDELIVDRSQMKVRYLDVEINDSLLANDDRDAHLLIPIGTAQLDSENDEVWLDTFSLTALIRTPLFRGGPITRDIENSIRKALRPDWNYDREMLDNDYYNESEYNSDRFYERRRRRRES